MPRPWFSIIGSGRSGTGYMAALMKANGLRCGHEEYYNPIRMEGDDQDESLDGDSSWLALPYLEQGLDDTLSIHITRDPVAVVKSLLAIRFFHPETEQAPFPQFLRRHSNVFNNPDPLVRAVEFWVEWNQRCANLAHVTMKLEKFDYPLLSQVLDQSIKPKNLGTRINHVPETLHMGRVPDITPVQIILDQLGGRQERFGY